MADHSKKDQADAQFKKLQRAEDGKKAMSEYESELAAIRTKTARLRALRLARDAAELAVVPAPVVVTKKTPAKRTKKASGTLSQWLTDQQASGRRS